MNPNVESNRPMTTLPDLWQAPQNCYRAVLPLTGLLPRTANVVYRSANNMSPLACGANFFVPGAGDGDYPSDDLIVLGDAAESNYLLAGAVTCRRSMSYFTLRRNNNRPVEIEVRQPEIAPGETPEEIVLLTGSDWRELLCEYARITAEKMDARLPRATGNLVGYCSWYYEYHDVTARQFLANVDAIADSQTDFSGGVAQLDSGYQPFHGDWLELRAEWDVPLAEMAAHIRKRGMTPGIWLAPVIASKASRVYREHPEWFVREPNGEAAGSPGWTAPPDNDWLCLDGTNPEVCAHLQQVFRTMWEYGFRYFKLDALGYGFAPGIRRDPDATSVSAFRRMLTAIREAVPEAYLLCCSSPFLPVLGLTDGCRIGCDTAAKWDCDMHIPKNAERHPGKPCIRNAWHDTLTNWWMIDRFFRADPDVVIARDNHTLSSFGEARISAAGAILCGVAFSSDRFQLLAPERLELLRITTRYQLKNPRPMDWIPDSWPHIFSGTIDGAPAFLVVNDCETEQEFNLAIYGLAAEGSGLFGRNTENCVLTLPAHDAEIIVERQR